ncbi:hypothetical protein GGF31_001546 [Allomyces arbusculus]|nr:hypothetical protein GGF31_001546 [Allomyces arbusculus]
MSPSPPRPNCRLSHPGATCKIPRMANAYLSQFTAVASSPTTTATERPSGRWSPRSLPRRRKQAYSDEWRAIERPRSAERWVSSKSLDASSIYMDAKTNSFRATV